MLQRHHVNYIRILTDLVNGQPQALSHLHHTVGAANSIVGGTKPGKQVGAGRALILTQRYDHLEIISFPSGRPRFDSPN